MRKCRVLVVDDDSNLLCLLRERLEDEGYEVTTAHSAGEGLIAYLASKPDLLLTDITMGEEDGLALVRRVRSHDPGVRTIYMTGDPDRYRTELELERRLYHAHVLEKPFLGQDLIDAISSRALHDAPTAAA